MTSRHAEKERHRKLKPALFSGEARPPGIYRSKAHQFYLAYRHSIKSPYETFRVDAITCFRRHCQPLSYKIVEMTRVPALWSVCPDSDGLGRMLSELLVQRKNWLQNQDPYLYFLVPDDVAFSYGQHLSLHLLPEPYTNMTTVIGRMRQVS